MTQGLKMLCIGIVALLVVVGGARYFAHSRQTTSEAEGIGQQVKITIAKKDDESAVARKLHDAGLIHSELYFKSLMKVKSGVLIPGTYVLSKGLSVSVIIGIITD